MSSALEDELGDILQKARDGKSWSQEDLAIAADLTLDEVRRIDGARQLILAGSLSFHYANTLFFFG